MKIKEFKGKLYMECKVLLIPTNKPSKLSLLGNGVLNYGAEAISSTNTKLYHLYIITNEKGGSVDWGFKNNFNIDFDFDPAFQFKGHPANPQDWNRLIATTDTTKDLSTKIPESYIQKFVTGNKRVDKIFIEVTKKQKFEPDKDKREDVRNGVYYEYNPVLDNNEVKILYNITSRFLKRCRIVQIPSLSDDPTVVLLKNMSMSFNHGQENIDKGINICIVSNDIIKPEDLCLVEGHERILQCKGFEENGDILMDNGLPYIKDKCFKVIAMSDVYKFDFINKEGDFSAKRIDKKNIIDYIFNYNNEFQISDCVIPYYGESFEQSDPKHFNDYITVYHIKENYNSSDVANLIFQAVYSLDKSGIISNEEIINFVDLIS